MGQKTNPIGFRLAVRRNWQSRWYASKKDFPKLLAEDQLIRTKLMEKLGYGKGYRYTPLEDSAGQQYIPDELKNKKYKLAGNIPYYITGYLFRVISELKHKPERAIFMIQKEVAERVCAIPPRMNILSASIQFWADSSILKIVPHAPRPSPGSASAILVLMFVHP